MVYGEVELDRESIDLYVVMGEGYPLTENPKWSFTLIKPHIPHPAQKIGYFLRRM